VLGITAVACALVQDGTGFIVGRWIGLALVPILLHPWQPPRWAVWLGDLSYELYMTHTIIFAMLPPILLPLALPVAWVAERLTHWRGFGAWRLPKGIQPQAAYHQSEHSEPGIVT